MNAGKKQKYPIVYIGNLNYKTKETDLKHLFSNYGEIIQISLIKDKEKGLNKGIAFITMKNFNDAERAIKQFDGQELDGRKLKVSFSQSDYVLAIPHEIKEPTEEKIKKNLIQKKKGPRGKKPSNLDKLMDHLKSKKK